MAYQSGQKIAHRKALTFNDGIHRAGLLTKTTIDTLGHVDIYTRSQIAVSGPA
jgi:hypothetical protein